MERVYYEYPNTDDEATREGKFEAVLDVVCHGEQKSDLVPLASYNRILVAYDVTEKNALEPMVLAIMQNVDRTYWGIADAYTGVKES